MIRSYEQELNFIEKISDVEYRIKKGFVPSMNVSFKYLFFVTLRCLFINEF